MFATPLAARAEQPQPDAEQAALEAAGDWLALVDQGQYAESWEEAAPLFKGALERERWSQTLRGVRAPLGALVSREAKSREYRTSLPGAPDGRYVIIQYETVFENKRVALETVTPMLAPDGRWRVSGYYIK